MKAKRIDIDQPRARSGVRGQHLLDEAISDTTRPVIVAGSNATVEHVVAKLSRQPVAVRQKYHHRRDDRIHRGASIPLPRSSRWTPASPNQVERGGRWFQRDDIDSTGARKDAALSA
jgi:hypothetical protein